MSLKYESASVPGGADAAPPGGFFLSSSLLLSSLELSDTQVYEP